MEENNTYEAIKEIAGKIYKYLKKEKNLGVVTWITTAFIAVSVSILKFIRFVWESGILGYWKISPVIINVTGDNVVYDFIVTTIFAVVVLGLFLVPYFIIKSKMRIRNKIAIIVTIASILSIIMFFGSNVSEIMRNSFWIGIFTFLIVDVIFLFICFSPTIAVMLITKPSKDSRKPLTSKRMAGVVIALTAIYSLYFYFSAFFSAMTETNYRITKDGYAIVYETDSVYYLAKYDEENKIILKDNQKVIEKKGVEYIWRNIKE